MKNKSLGGDDEGEGRGHRQGQYGVKVGGPFPVQVDVLQRESRKRLESESDSRKNQDKFVEELRAREQDMLQQVSALKTDKQRLEDTIYRLKAEALTTTVTLKQLEENMMEEKTSRVCMGKGNTVEHSASGLRLRATVCSLIIHELS